MAKLVLTIQANDKASESVRALKAEVQALSASLSSVKVNKDLTAQINALTKNYTAAIEAQTKLAQNTSKEAAGIETTRKGYANLITTLKTIKSQYADGVFGRLPKDAERSFRRIQEISAAFQKNKTLTEGQAKAYANLSQKLKKLSADLATVKAKNDKIVAANPFTVTQAQQIPRLIKQYSTLLNHIKSIEKYYPKGTFDTFKADLTQGQADLQALNNEFQTTGTLSQEGQAKLNALANAYNQVGAAVKKIEAEMQSSKGTLKDIVGGFFKFQLAAMLVMKPLQWIRSALTSLNETLVKTEDAVIALQRVLPTGSATDDEISSRLYKVAQDYGQTFENVSQIATNFARTGMSWADTIKATEAAVLALNVAELDATEASEGLISILTQFGMQASELESVVDRLNKAADKNPVTTEKLLTALQRTGAAAQNANITLDETIGIITTLSKATNRSGENLGTAVNSLIQFSSKESSLDTFAKFGGDVEVAVEKFRAGAGSILEIWEELGEVIQNRQGEAESILGGGLFNNEEWAQLNDELKEALGESYADITDIYNTASVFRRNYFVALLNDMDNVKKVTDDIADANGYSQAENEKALQTYTKRLNSLKAQWEDIANSAQGILGIKKALVDVGSVLLTIIKWTGGLRTTLLAISTVVWALVGDKILAGLKSIGTAIKGLITGLFTAQKAAQGLQAALGAIGLIATAISLVVGFFESLDDDREMRIAENLSNAQSELSDLSDSLTKLEEQYRGYIDTVKEARSVLDDKTSSTENLEKAQNSLLQLQGDLIRNNKEYNGSLDLVNGSLDEQLKKIKEIEEENARQQVRDWLDSNADATYESEQYLKEHVLTLFNEYSDPYGGGDTLLLKYLQAHGYNAYADITDEGFFENMGNSFGALFGKNTLRTQLNIDGFTREDYIDLFKQLREELEASDYTDDERDYLRAQLADAINYWEKGEYQNRYNLIEGDANSSNWIERLTQEQRKLFAAGKLTLEQIYEILGIHKSISKETVEWHNNIAKVTEEYDKLVEALEKLWDAEKENLDLEEKKKDYLEAQNELIKAQQALENARNEATVRRYNEATGQWEWQVDEKKVAEAEEAVKDKEENLENARQGLKDQVYDTLIELLDKEDPPTNEELVDLLNGLENFLGSGFIEKIKAAILDNTGVDLGKPINESGNSASDNKKWTSYADAKSAGFANIRTEREFNRGGSDKEEYGDYQTYLDAMYEKYMGGTFDSGGMALGKGYMPKETEKPEGVLPPDLTSLILSPVSSERFHQFVKDAGIILETDRPSRPQPIIERIGGPTDNRVDNSGQIIFGGGLTVGADKRNASLDEILALGGIVPKV